jgi:UDP-glucose 4-epimerase
MKTAIVTGGAGFIGSHLVDRLLREEWEVVNVDDFSTHHDKRWPMNTAYLLQGRVQDVVMRKPHVDAIFHLAGKVGPTGVLRYAGLIAKDTVDSTTRVADWGKWYECPVIDISTSEIYGSPDKENAEHDPKVFPTSHSARMEYAVAKLAAETLLLNTPDLDVRIVRPFNIAGPRQRPDGGFVIPRFVQQALQDKTLTVYAPGTQRRAFTHVDDFVDGVMLAYHKGVKGEAYNMGNPWNVASIMDIAATVLAEVGKGRIEVVDPNTLHGPEFREAPEKVPNADKAMRELGWMPKYGRRRIITDTITYWKGEWGL